jgi:hypothetical protein
MGFKLPDHSAAGPIEKRWFSGVLAFSVAAGLVFYGRMAFIGWGMRELGARKQAAGSNERMVGSVTEFMHQVELGNQIGWGLLLICCAGFLICAGMWFRTMKMRLRAERKR